jgi:hypothetical protein
MLTLTLVLLLAREEESVLACVVVSGGQALGGGRSCSYSLHLLPVHLSCRQVRSRVCARTVSVCLCVSVWSRSVSVSWVCVCVSVCLSTFAMAAPCAHGAALRVRAA